MHNRLWALFAICILGTAIAGEPVEMYAWASRWSGLGYDAVRWGFGAAAIVVLIAQVAAERRAILDQGRRQLPLSVQLLILAAGMLYVWYAFVWE